jgi:hypothetical protein
MISFPKKISTETILYESTLTPQATYKVIINPNEVYSGNTLDEGKIYSKKLLNYIQADFGVDYIGNKKIPLDIEYQIIATVNGFEGNEDGKTIYWTKNIPLSTKKTLKEENGTWSRTERVIFTLANYDAFTVRAKDITGMDVSNELLISMTGKVIAHTEKEDLVTPFNVNLQIPLMEDAFQITKSKLDPDQKSVTVKVEKPATFNLFRAMPYCILLALSLIVLIMMLFFTREPSRIEILKKTTNNLIKNYGSRIVALQDIPKMNYRQHYKVHSMKDMIKIADELQKPIFYEVDSTTVVKEYEFHIIEEDTIYTLFLDSAEA